MIAMFALVATLVAAAQPSLPWKTFSEASADVVDVTPSMCQGGPVIKIVLSKDDTSYLVFVTETGERWVAGRVNAAGTLVDYVWAGTADGDKIVVSLSRPRMDAEEGPCPLLFPVGA